MRLRLVFLLLCLALSPAVVAADRDAERHADPDARIRFRYDWLQQDLERVSQGIREHLQAPRAEPRRVEPLRGDYRR